MPVEAVGLPSIDDMKLFGAHNHDAQKIEMLKNIPIFKTLTRNELLEVDELLHERTYGAGEIIFEKGEMGHGIYIILEGRVRVNPCPELPASAILELGRNEMIGEMALFEEIPRLATIVAAEPTKMAALFQFEFSSLLTSNKDIGVKVLVEITRILGRRARQLLIRQKDVPMI